MTRRAKLLTAFVVVMLVVGTGTAYAFWTAGAGGDAAASAGSVNAGNTPSGSATGTSVTISWAATTTAAGGAVQGYVITRYNAPSGGTGVAATNGCAGTVAALNCTETGLANGTWYYTVTPKLQNWLGTESGRSTGIPVNADGTAPVFTITTSGSNPYYSGSGNTVYFDNVGSGSFTVTASDPETGITAASFAAAPGGWTRAPVSPTTFATYTRSSGNATVPLTGFSATNGASLTTNFTVNLTLDTAGPTNSLSLSDQTGGGSFLSVATNRIYYQGNSPVGGSFSITNAVSDVLSGPGSSAFPALSGSSTGWSYSASTVSSPAGGPYESNSFTWASATSTQPSETVTGADNVGNTTAASALTLTNDNTVQNAGALTVNSTSATTGGTSSSTSSTSFTIGTRTNPTETQSSTQSGLASSSLTVQSATYTNNTCGAAGSGGPFTSPTTISGTAQPSGIVAGACYIYRLTGVDNVGNSVSLVTTVAVYGAATQIMLLGSTSDLGSGGTRTLTARIADANGNTVLTGADATRTVTFAQTSGAGSVTFGGGATVNAVAGVATKVITGVSTGSVTLRASATLTVGASNSNTLTFNISAAPTITFPTTANPHNAGHNTGAKTIIVTGTGFQAGLTVTASGVFTINSFTFIDSTSISVTLTGSGGNNQKGNLTVTNPDGGTVTTNNSLNNGNG